MANGKTFVPLVAAKADKPAQRKESRAPGAAVGIESPNTAHLHTDLAIGALAAGGFEARDKLPQVLAGPDAFLRLQQLAGNEFVSKILTGPSAPDFASPKPENLVPGKSGKTSAKPQDEKESGQPNLGGSQSKEGMVEVADKSTDSTESGKQAGDVGKGEDGAAAKGLHATEGIGAQVGSKGEVASGLAVSDTEADVSNARATGTESVGAGEDVLEEIPEPPPPRFEGTQALRLTPPHLSAQQSEQVRAQTGRTVNEHYEYVQTQLDRLAIRAEQEQRSIVIHIEMKVADARRDLDASADQIPDHISAAIGSIRGVYGGARASISKAAEDALKTIKKHATEADKQVDQAALSTKEAVENVVLASSPKLQALYQETMTPLRNLLTNTANALKSVGKSGGEAMVTKGKEVAKELLGEGKTAIDQAQKEQESKAVPDLAQEGAKDLQQAGEDGAADILDQESTLGMSFLLMVNQSAVKVEQIGTKDAGTAGSKGGQVRLRLTNDYERACAFVEQTRERAHKALEAGEKSSVAQLRKMEGRLKVMARQRRDALCNAMLRGEAPAADAWAQQMTRVNQIVLPGQLIDSRSLEPRLAEAMESMNALSVSQRVDFDAQAQSGFDDARRGLTENRGNVDEATNAALAGTNGIEQQVSTMRQIGNNFAAGFRGVAQPASSAAGEFRTQAEEKLGQPVKAVRDAMKKLLGETTGSLKETVTKFGTKLNEQVTNLRTNLAPAFDQIAASVIQGTQESLMERSNQLYAAMDIVGTTESSVFKALHKLTPKMGKALEEYWRPRHVHDLRWWLYDELSDNDYEAAIHYLDGDPAGGAKYELAASLHWYGDDTEQIETALRALSTDDLKKLKNDPGFEQVNRDVQSSLSGTNLDVTNALLAGRTARADALRLKEQIDEARSSESDDKLHDALSKVDPKQLSEVQRELADVLAGNKMTDKLPSLEDKDTTKALTDYITRPVQVYDPDSEAERTVTLSEPSKTLAVALATKGEGSPEARAARLAFEASRDGKPRVDKLAKALDDPDLVRARKNPLLSKPDENPRAAARAQAELDRLEKQRSDMMMKYAELRGADEATKKDTARAKDYTEKAVADMFGNDDLGRKLGSSMVRDARANPAVAIKFAVRGWGTKEELIRQTLRGMTSAEIAELKKDYAARFGDGNPNALYDDLGVFQNKNTAEAAGVEHATGGGFFTELSSDERQEVEELLIGAPQNDRDHYRLARLKAEHQQGEGTTWVGRGMGLADSEPARALKKDQARMEKMIADAGGPEIAFDEKGNFVNRPEIGLSTNDFRVHVAGTSGAAGDYKHHVDSIADMVTGAIAIIGAIVGTIVVTVLTAGTATPLVIGLWAAGIAAATGAASMAVNYAMKGSRYGWEQAAVDGALTLLDAATAGLMAGAGAKAARAATQLAAIKAAARTPTQAAVASRLAQRATQKELVRGFVRAAAGSGVSGMARTAATDGTWDEGILHGVGNVVAGGVKAATIGVATHGAVTGFHSAGVGQSLSRSTSFFGRGLGAGLSGAVGGMAGRTTEVGIDALGGKKQGPWYEVLGSIVSSGGRGFVENFGQGMAEVPKARRDEAQARMDHERAQADAKRVARYGPSAEDYTGDAQFRRKAAASALHEDKRTDLKQFLSDLDVGVTGDHATQETHHKLTRAFRREALAGIPPEQRGEFAEVSIHILSDTDFERFTGSASGRAVTIFVDGEPKIIARKSAAPEDMREEGIHVLQSRDPRWKNRIGRLDESNLARWKELDLESQLSLYRDKLEIEIDAQEQLRRGLLEEAGVSADPTKRASLRARADETVATEQALRTRRTEVDGLGPTERAAIQKGDADFPQYLREEPRLFAKKKVPNELRPDKLALTKRDSPLDHDSPELANEKRRPVSIENTTWEDEHRGKQVRQVGDAWTEPETYRRSGRVDTRDRWYRMVEVVDGADNVIDRRREILQITGKQRWQQRGSESTTWGRIFEEASRLRTMGGKTINPNQDERVPIGALRELTGDPNKPLSAQHGGGAGFDDVVLEFRIVNGREEARIVIVEAKGYRRSLALGDFSAITINMERNLSQLSEAINYSNLSRERRNAVQRAILYRDLSFDVHTSPTTKLGGIEVQGASILRDIQSTELARRQLTALQEHLMNVEPTPLTGKEREGLRADMKRVEGLSKRLEASYKTDPFNAAEVEAALGAILEGAGRAKPIADIAERHGLRLDKDLPTVRRTKIETESDDKPYIEAAKASLSKGKDLLRSTRLATSVAEQAGFGDQTFRPVSTAPTEDSDLRVVRSANGTKSVALTRPSTADSAAARQLVGLVHDGVTLVDGKTRLDHVIWDATQARPAEVGSVLREVRQALDANLDDSSRLHILLPVSLADNEAKLRKMFSLPPSVRINLIDRPPYDGTTWLVSFEPRSNVRGTRR